MIHSTLYKRDSKDKVRIWFMESEGNQYRTTSGLQDGQKVVTDWTTVEGKNTGKKNATTAEQQALKDVESEYKKQKKSYYFESIDDIDVQLHIEPMLAKKYKDYVDKIDFTTKNYIAQIKFNGCLFESTLIALSDGSSRTIREIVDSKQNVEVITYNNLTQTLENNKITGFSIVPPGDSVWYDIELENGDIIKITGEHQVWVENLKCWREVKELDGTEELLPLNLS